MPDYSYSGGLGSTDSSTDSDGYTGGTNFGNYTEDNGNGGFNSINVSDYGMSPSDSGYGYNPNYGGSSSQSNDYFGGSYDNYGTNGFAPSPSYNDFPADAYNAPAPPAAWDGSIGDLDFGRYSQDALDANDTYSAEQGFFDSPFGRNLKKFGMFALNVHPATRTAMGLYNAYDALSSGEMGRGLGGLLGMATGNPLAGSLAGLGIDAYNGVPGTGSRAGSTLGGMVGSRLGGEAAGPFGAALGGDLGSYMGRTIANAPQGTGNPGPADNTGRGGVQQPQQVASKEGDGYNAIAGGLMGLYGLHQMRGTSRDQQRAIAENTAAQQAQIAALQAQINKPAGHAPAMRSPNFGAISSKLDGMFGPRSGVAREMRTQLERKDAAAGRRSQYGPREVQLMSELTRLRAQAEPGYMNAEIAAANAANQGAMSVYNSQQQANQSRLQQLLAANGQTNSSNSAALNAQMAAQAASDQRRQQGLAMLYGMGRETGAFNSLGNSVSNWWNAG